MVDTTFQDMKRRVRNEGKCPMRFLSAKPWCWPYGELLFVYNTDGLTATFGDLTIPLETADEVAQLVALADGQYHRFTQDLEWGWESNCVTTTTTPPMNEEERQAYLQWLLDRPLVRR